MRKRGHFVVEGRVQGVGFRAYTRHEARSLGLTGWVHNRPDGAVEIVAEGEESDVRQLRRWCHDGPSSAIVRNVKENYSEATGEFHAFDIR